MNAVLRFIGVTNAAIWLGSAIFFTFCVAPAVFYSPEMKELFGPVFREYAGAVAQVLLQYFYRLQYVCAGVAVVHLLAEWLYTRRSVERRRIQILGWVILLGLVGGLLLQPHLKRLHYTRSSPASTPAQKEVAAKSFARWHGVSQVINLVAMAGLLVYFWRLTSPPNPEVAPRFFSENKFKF